MKKIEPVKIKIRQTNNYALLHDSRSDVKRLSDAINMLIDKQNEMIETINKLIDLQKGDTP